MNEHKFRPGDVVRVKPGRPFGGDVGIVTEVGDNGAVCLAVAGSMVRPDVRIFGPRDLRPLLVLDPEDADQMERLAEELRNVPGGLPIGAEDTKRALRSLLDPKPEEPKGLGAVVRDGSGDLWVRDCPANCPDGAGCIPWAHVDSGVRHKWDLFSSVTVEHEGWIQ